MIVNILLVVGLAAIAIESDAAVAPFITKCAAADSNCAKQSAQAAVPHFIKGLPDLKVETLDPIHYDTFDATSRNLKFILNDLTVTGLKGCKVEEVRRDVAKSKLFVKGLCTVVLDSQYEMTGSILILPIRGKGKFHAELKKLAIDVEANMGEKEKNGVKYWDVKSWSHSYELRDNSVLELENLFDGNEELGRAVQLLLKTEANAVVNEVGPGIIKNILSKVVKNVNHFFHRVPLDELAID